MMKYLHPAFSKKRALELFYHDSHCQGKTNVILKAPILIIAQKNHRHCFGFNRSANKVTLLGR